ncbi:MAG: HzsA-related protein [Thermoguttaceae bacterium]
MHPKSALAAVLLAAVSALDAHAAETAAPAETMSLDPQQVYVRRATWAETMLATRANCAQWAGTAQEFRLQETSLVAVWRRMAKDWPVPCGWFVRDLPRGRHLDWFLHARDTSFERWIMRGWTPESGGMRARLAGQFAAFQQARVAADDPRWLDLYGRGCRWEDVAAATSPIWLGELREALESRADELLLADTACEDPRWAAIQQQAARCRDAGPPVHAGSVASLRQALELFGASPNRLAGADRLSERLDEAEPQWNRVVAALLAGDTAALDQLPTLHGQVREFRLALLRSLAGMPEFLDRWSAVDLQAEWERQFVALQHDLENHAHFEKVAGQALRPESLVLADDRDPADVVLRRTESLFRDLLPVAPGLAPLEAELARLRALGQSIAPDGSEARYLLFAEACRLRRQIAFSNPLLAFDRLLFLKRHLAIYDHMCDQFYGITARPGGGLFVLDDPFGPQARARNLLADSVVEQGRLKGERLDGGPDRPWNLRYDGLGKLSGDETEGGSFLSPDVSFDGRQIVFAYVECRGDREHRTHTDPARGHWPEGRCYHVFKVGADGSGLRQLTDGDWNDFDPCWMPSGRIAMISERRGGYLRCGRICPTFTVYDMAADGSDIRCLSYHETNEWQPSVTHEGMLVYTRWDYVDRFSMVAHHPWVITPSGRDPRALQGNFTDRRTRPDFEADIRAIPGSHRFVATAAPHHGQSFGSLVVFDPRVADDDAMSAVKRVTPEVGFPESQGGTTAYGEAWPLAEDYYLCAYDPAAEVPQLGLKGEHGLYLVDSFGNKELIYRDPAIGCHSPMPLAARHRPPVVGDRPEILAEGRPAEANVGVVNVYHSRQAWPPGTKIAALRVVQVLPLSVGSDATAHNTGLQIPGSYSINIARAVLGTVPVEPDGSAHFTVPAGKELYFQALDVQGLAVTSMRSGTQFQPGETATCQGCHEPRHGSLPAPASVPLAMQRGPSRMKPDVDGTNPFSYPRLVQPVLEKHCVACHRQEAGKAPPLDAGLVFRPSGGFMDRPTTYYASYLSLAPEFGFYNYGNELNTIPGRFGAQASPLYRLLREDHYGVKLPPDDLHRIVVWLDSCSVFYGVYEKEGGLAQLRGEIARPTLE